MDGAAPASAPSVLASVAAVLPETLGAVGVGLYVGSYPLLMFGLIRGDGYAYAALNLAGAIAIILSVVGVFSLGAVFSEVLWVTLSIVGMVRIYLVRKYLRLTDDERAAARRLVPGLPKDRQRRLLRLGAWTDAAPGLVLTREGEPVGHLVFVARGLCRIEIGGALVAGLGAGALIGEMTYHTGLPATATVTVETPARLLTFRRDALNGFLRRNEDLRAAVEQSVAGDLRDKLAATSRALAERCREEADLPG